MTSREKLEEYSTIDLAEAMIDNVEGFEDRDPQDLAENWDRSDMIKELLWADVEEDDEEE